MEINVEQLISEVYARPGLWDQNNKSYHNRAIVDKLWQNIQAEMKIPTKHLRKKWKYLRDQFRVECKKLPAAKSEDEELELYSTWPYFKFLIFLKPQIKFRKRAAANTVKETTKTANGSDSEMDTETPAEICATNNYELIDCPLFESFKVKSELSSPKKRKSVKRSNSDRIVEIEKKKLDLLEQKVKSRIDRDEDEAFFDCLLPHMRKLKPEQKLLCRIELQEVVHKHVYGTLAAEEMDRFIAPN